MGFLRHSRLLGWLFAAGILAAAAPAHADIHITRSADATTLANALVGGSGAGITVTNATLSSPGTGPSGEMSSGVFTITTSPDTYGLPKGGIVLSTGDVADDGTASNTTPCTTTLDCLSFSYSSSATAAQETLFSTVCPGTHKDVTQLDLTFTVDAGVDTLALTVAFASDEYPTFDGIPSLVDCFALFVNGSNVAMANGDVFTVANSGFDAASGTQFNGALMANNGSGVEPHVNLAITGLTPGSTNNHMTLILADRTDNLIDTGIYLSAFGASPPVADNTIFVDNFEGGNLACWSSQVGGTGGGSCSQGSAPLTASSLPVHELPWDHVLPAHLRILPKP